MNLEVETLDTHEARLTIRVDEPLLAHARREAAKKLSSRVRVPGFRPGHVPLPMLIRAIGGEEVFAAEVAEHLLADLYPKALDQAGIEPYAPGQIEAIHLNATTPEVVVRVPLVPKVDLKDYRSIRLPFPEVSVSEEEVENALQDLRQRHAVVELVERPAAEGDAVEMDLVASDQSGKPVLVVRSERFFVLDRQRVNLPEIVDLVVGMSAGEHKEASLTVPEDFEEASLRGQTLKVVIDLRRVNSRTLPGLDDTLAQTVGNFNTLDELRQDVRARLLEEATEEAQALYRESVIEAFIKLADVKMPPVFVEERLDREIQEWREKVSVQTGLPFSEWLKVQGKTEEALREELRPQVERRARIGLLLSQVAASESITVTEAEINEVVNNYLSEFSDNQEMRDQERKRLMRGEARKELHIRMLTNRVLERMVAIARGEVEPASQSTAPATLEAAS